MAEMTPEEIKEKKPYLDWSLTEHEYDFICEKLLHRLPNYTETGLFSVMWSEHCSYKSQNRYCACFLTRMKEFCKDLVKVRVLLILAIIRQLSLKLKVIIILQPLNHMKVLQQA